MIPLELRAYFDGDLKVVWVTPNELLPQYVQVLPSQLIQNVVEVSSCGRRDAEKLFYTCCAIFDAEMILCYLDVMLVGADGWERSLMLVWMIWWLIAINSELLCVRLSRHLKDS